jgi:hypothetical protein
VIFRTEHFKQLLMSGESTASESIDQASVDAVRLRRREQMRAESQALVVCISGLARLPILSHRRCRSRPRESSAQHALTTLTSADDTASCVPAQTCSPSQSVRGSGDGHHWTRPKAAHDLRSNDGPSNRRIRWGRILVRSRRRKLDSYVLSLTGRRHRESVHSARRRVMPRHTSKASTTISADHAKRRTCPYLDRHSRCPRSC